MADQVTNQNNNQQVEKLNKDIERLTKERDNLSVNVSNQTEIITNLRGTIAGLKKADVTAETLSYDESFIKFISLSMSKLLMGKENMQRIRASLREVWEACPVERRNELSNKFREQTKNLRRFAEAIDEEFYTISVKQTHQV